MPSLKRKFYDSDIALQQRDTIDPQQESGDRETFLQNFDWPRSVPTAEQIQEMQELLGEYIDNFEKHRFDVGYKTELKVKLAPDHDSPVYFQCPTTRLHLRDEILVEPALMQYYGIVTLPQIANIVVPFLLNANHQGNWEFSLILDELITSLGMITVTIVFPYQT